MSAVDLQDRDASRLASALALVTTLTAAAETTAAIHARRRGDLPSGTRARADESDDLDAARADAEELLRQVARSVLAVDERADRDAFDGEPLGGETLASDTLGRGVRMAGLALTLQRLGRRLHALHQHLLGLYEPGAAMTGAGEALEDGVIEGVRRLAAQAGALLDGSRDAADGPALLAFAGHGLRVLAAVPTGASLR